MRRQRHAKIVATLGPSSSDLPSIQALFATGADVFRLNFSHGTQDQHKERVDIIRRIERDNGRPIAILLDLQGIEASRWNVRPRPDCPRGRSHLPVGSRCNAG